MLFVRRGPRSAGEEVMRGQHSTAQHSTHCERYSDGDVQLDDYQCGDVLLKTHTRCCRSHISASVPRVGLDGD